MPINGRQIAYIVMAGLRPGHLDEGRSAILSETRGTSPRVTNKLSKGHGR